MSDWPQFLRIRPIQTWPGNLTRSRQRARFDSPWRSTLDLLGRELRSLNAKNAVLQVAMNELDFRNDGFPRAQAKAEHPGVILSLDSPYGPLSWPCDTFTTWQDNVRAIALAMEALRKVDRYGVTKRGEQYTGWKAIGGSSDSDPREVLRLWAGKVGHGEESADDRLSRWARIGAHPDRHDGDHGPSNSVIAALSQLGLS